LSKVSGFQDPERRAQGRKLYRHIVTRLAAIGVRREDTQIAATETHYEDWYAGRLYDE
jgi:hypothetical protein